jgi:DNA-binding transcriptional ArsR family regulator
MVKYMAIRKNFAVDQLSATFGALADPTRRAILARLAGGETSVTELARPFNISLPAVSKHLRVLQRAGLIGQSRAAQVRPCKLQAEPLKLAADWVEGYRKFWEQSFDRLDDYLRELQAKKKPAAKPQPGKPAAAKLKGKYHD